MKDNPIGIGRIEYAYYKMATACGDRIIQQIVKTVSQWESYANDAAVRKEQIKQIKETLRLF